MRRLAFNSGILSVGTYAAQVATLLLYAGIGFLIVTHPSTRWPYWIFWAGLILAVVAGVVYAYGAWREVRR